MWFSRLLLLSCALSIYSFAGPQDGDYLALRRMIGEEKYDDAIKKCTDLICEHPDYLPFYETLPEVARYAGKIEKAVDFFEARVENGTALPFVYYGLGITYYSKRDYRAAVIYFNNAIDAGNTTAECYRGFEYAYEKLEGLEATIRLFNVQCNRDSRNPNNWYGLALAYWSKEDFAQVRLCLHEALSRKPDDRRYLQARAAIAYLQGQSNTAREMKESLFKRADAEMDFSGKEFLRSFAIIDRFTREKYESTERTIIEMIQESKSLGLLRWLGWGYKQMSDMKYVMTAYQEALTFAKEAESVAFRTQDDELTLAALNREFEIYSEVGDYYNALGTAYRKETVAQEGGLTRERIRSLNDIARTLHGLGSDETALEFALEALARSDAFGGDSALVFPIYTVLGLVHEGLGNYEEAIKNYCRATSVIPRDQFWSNNAVVMHNRLARGYLKLRLFSESAKHLSLQLMLSQSLGNELEECYAEAYLGMLYLERGDLKFAWSIFQRTFEKGSKLGQLPSTLVCARGLSILAERRGCLNEAAIWREKAIQITESMGLWHEKLLALSGPNREFVSDYQEYVRLLCRLGKPESALQAAERSKALSLAKLVSLPLTDKSPLSSDPVRGRLSALHKQIFQLHSRLAAEIPPDVPLNTSESKLRKLTDLSHLEMLFQSMLDSLRMCNDKFYGLLRPKVASAVDIQRALLDSSGAFIEFMVGENCTSVIVVKKDTLFSYEVPVSALGLRNLLIRTSKVFSGGHPEGGVMNAALADFDPMALHEAFELLLRPTIAQLKGIRNLTLVPDGILRNLPFEILVSGWKEARGDTTRRTPKFLIEDFEINYFLCASTDLALRTESRMPTRTILAIGNPSIEEPSRFIGDKRISCGGEPTRSNRVHSFPGVIQEISAIKRVFGNSADILLESEASSEQFNELASKYQILHIAAHVVFDDAMPMYSRIVLFPNGNDGDNNIIRAFDFLSITLNAELAVLSGCNTGKSSSRLGLEGMTSAIMFSGVPSVIASLWTVDDEVTAGMMESFYAYLKQGLGRGEALRRAKLDMLRDGKSDPFYWGAFVLCGESGKLSFPDTLNEPSSFNRIPTIVAALLSSILLVLILLHRHRVRVTRGWG